MKIGIMGGTFDPIHNGHLMLGDTARDQFGLDVIWFMPNGRPPHKALDSIGSDTDMRAKMVELAIKDHKSFELQDYELKEKKSPIRMRHWNIFMQYIRKMNFILLLVRTLFVILKNGCIQSGCLRSATCWLLTGMSGIPDRQCWNIFLT